MELPGLSPPSPYLGGAILTHSTDSFQKTDRYSVIFQTSTPLSNVIEIGLQGQAYQWEEPDGQTD